MIAKRVHRLAGVIGVVAALTGQALADPTEDFYKTKTVTLVVGYSAGGGFDLYGCCT